MRIALLALLAVLTLLLFRATEQYLEDRADPPVLDAATFLAGDRSERHVILTDAYLDFLNLSWSSKGNGRIDDVFIPVEARSSESATGLLQLVSRTDEDRELARKLAAATGEEEALGLVRAAFEARGQPERLDLYRESTPDLEGATFAPETVFVRDTGGTRIPFPTFFVLAAALAAIVAAIEIAQGSPRTPFRLGSETVTIVGISPAETGRLADILDAGGRLVRYQWCLSVLILTFKRPTTLYLIRPGQSALARGIPPTFLSLVLGWWGIPWGPIYTLQSLWVNLRGGTVVDLAADDGAPSSPPPLPR